MQTNLNEKSTFFERIMYISKNQGYKNITEFAKNALGYDSPQKILRLKDEINKPSVNILIDISNKFENVNINWLLTGHGHPLNDADATDKINQGIESVINPNNELLIETQQKLIKSLEDQIQSLKLKLAAFAEQRKAG